MSLGNGPQAIAPWGGHRGLFGTNPIGFRRLPGPNHPPLVIDMSLSKVARGRIHVAAQAGEPDPAGLGIRRRRQSDDRRQRRDGRHDGCRSATPRAPSSP